MAQPVFLIELDSKGEFRFRLQALGNSENILHASEGYTTKQNCKKAIASVKVNSLIDSRYHRSVAKNGQPYFTLHAANGETLGISEMYDTTASRDNGINAVKRDAPTAKIVDRTLVS